MTERSPSRACLTFTLEGVPSDATTLIASFVGYGTLEVEIGNGTNLVISLEPDALFLDQVVVTALGIQRQAKEIGYATARVDSDDLNTTQNSDATQALIGKVSGLQISVLPRPSSERYPACRSVRHRPPSTPTCVSTCEAAVPSWATTSPCW